MTEEAVNLVLEQLSAICPDIGRIKEDMSGLRIETTATRHDMASLRTSQDMHHGDITKIKLRLDRIERRLDRVD